MSLSPRQHWQLQEIVRLLWNELDQAVQQLEAIQRARERYGPEVVAALEDLMTPQEWQSAYDTLTAYRDTLHQRLEAARGEELDPSPPEGDGP